MVCLDRISLLGEQLTKFQRKMAASFKLVYDTLEHSCRTSLTKYVFPQEVGALIWAVNGCLNRKFGGGCVFAICSDGFCDGGVFAVCGGGVLVVCGIAFCRLCFINECLFKSKARLYVLKYI